MLESTLSQEIIRKNFYGYIYNEVIVMTEKEKTEQEKKDQEEFARDYCKMIEAKLRKAEKHTWMLKDLDYLEQ